MKSRKNETTEMSFIKSISFSIGMIIFSFVAMTVSAWAMFSDNISNVTQQISGANFYVEAAVTKADGSEYQPIDSMFETGEYNITVTACGTVSERSGFFKVVLGDEASADSPKYFSPQMRTQNQAEKGLLDSYPTSVTFKLKLSDPVKVKLVSSWATYVADPSLSYINKDGSTVIEYSDPVIAPVEQNQDNNKASDSEAETKAATTVAATVVEETTEKVEEVTKLKKSMKSSMDNKVVKSSMNEKTTSAE